MDLLTKVSVYTIPGMPARQTPEGIVETVEMYTGQSIRTITRKREVVEARQITMYVLKQRTNLSLAAIGAVCGNKDHSTVLHALKTVENLLITDKKFTANYEPLLNQFNLK